jgi:dUTPase
MIRFYIEPGYRVKHPEREYGNAGIDFFIPEYTEVFENAFNEKNVHHNAYLEQSADGWFIIIPAHGRVNIPSGVRSRISPNVALEAQNKSGVATKHGLVYGAATVDANYQGIIHVSLINTSEYTVKMKLGAKAVQFIPRIIDTSTVEVFDNISFDEFYKNFEFSNRGEGAFGSTGI